jgi:lipopolysaccharide export system permease protein
MLRIVDRYIFKECAYATLAVVAVLLFILLGNSFVRVLGNIAEGKLSADSLLPMLAINMIQYLVILLSLGLYLGVLLGMGRFYRDSEMAALFAGGIGTLQLYRPLNYLAVTVALLSACLVFYLAPWAAAKQDELKHRARYQSKLAGLSAGQFNRSGTGGQTLFFESFDATGSVMREIFLYNPEAEKPEVQLAETGVQLRQEDGSPYLVFREGKSYSGGPGRTDYRITEFSSYGLRVRQKAAPALELRISSMPTSMLWSSERSHIAELHWRLAVPVSCLVLAFMALPLSHIQPRKGRFARLGIGILIYIVYSNLIGLGRVWLEQGTVPAWLGLWWVHLIFVTAVAALLMHREKAGLFITRRNGAKAA